MNFIYGAAQTSIIWLYNHRTREIENLSFEQYLEVIHMGQVDESDTL